jgi:hypothetical protein
MTANDLGSCPRCGKDTATIEEQASRFPWRVYCTACHWSTDLVRAKGVALKLWNEPKPATRA